jgi:hypothetical protein
VLVNELTNISVQFHYLEMNLQTDQFNLVILGDELTNRSVRSHRLEDKLTNRSV